MLFKIKGKENAKQESVHLGICGCREAVTNYGIVLIKIIPPRNVNKIHEISILFLELDLVCGRINFLAVTTLFRGTISAILAGRYTVRLSADLSVFLLGSQQLQYRFIQIRTEHPHKTILYLIVPSLMFAANISSGIKLAIIKWRTGVNCCQTIIIVRTGQMICYYTNVHQVHNNKTFIYYYRLFTMPQLYSNLLGTFICYYYKKNKHN